jgi:hypothetical protein
VEYAFKEFDTLCIQLGIKKELIVLYNPQQNEVAERTNMSIAAAKSTIHDLSLPMFLWVETCLTIVYILNRCPHRVFKDNTLGEAFTGKNPQVTHLHVVDCLVYIHIPNDKMTMLEPSSLKGILVGYSEISKAYQVYLPPQWKVIVSKDVKFDEDV